MVSPSLAPYVQVATTVLYNPFGIVDSAGVRAQLPVVRVTGVASKVVVSSNVHFKF